MNPLYDRGSMDPVHESGAWTGSKVGGPWTRGPCFVLNPLQQRCLSLSKGFPLQPALLQLFCSAS